MKTTRWTPDTCGCTVDYSWDETLPQDQRVHIGVAIVTQCGDHDGCPCNENPEAHYAHVLEENQRKNQAITAYLTQQNINQNDSVALAAAVGNLSFSFDPMDSTGFRRLHLTVNDSSCNLQQLQATVDSTQTKVVVVG